MCLDPTIVPDDRGHTSADLNSLRTIMLEMMDETRGTLKSTAVDWSAEAVHFLGSYFFYNTRRAFGCEFPQSLIRIIAKAC